MASRSLAYLDASALVKLVLDEPETPALRRHLGAVERKATSQIAIVEVTRAVRLADPVPQTLLDARRLFEEAELVRTTRAIIERAAGLASARLRSLDAIHLATALELRPDEFIAYDSRLLEAAGLSGLVAASPE